MRRGGLRAAWVRGFGHARSSPHIAVCSLLGAATLLARPRSRCTQLNACQGSSSSQSPAPAALVGRAPPAGNNKVLVRNGQAAAPWLDKEHLLKTYAGAYTTARTLEQTAILELSMHCRRLYETAVAVFARKQAAAPEGDATYSQARGAMEGLGPSGLKPLVCGEILHALEYLGARGSGAAGYLGARGAGAAGPEYQVTLLLTCDTVGQHTPAGRGFDIFTFVQPLPHIEPMVAVDAHRAERSNPTIKDVQWVSDRQHLEELQRASGVNEVLMYDGQGFVTEGLQTNFFAVAADGSLVTSPDSRVLAGTIRKVVLEVAPRAGIKVRMECPNINDLESWESCFICSTSRLVKPIRELHAPGLTATARKEFPSQGTLAHRIEDLVKEALRGNSELVTTASVSE